MNPKAFIECNDYDVGPFQPISFIPALKWKIFKSGWSNHPNKLPKQITMRARLGKFNITLGSSPYSYGMFYANCKDLRFFLYYSDLDTNDPEEAIYLTEKTLYEWLKQNSKFYESLADILESNLED